MSKKIFLFAIIILSSTQIILSQVLKDEIIKGEELKYFVDSIKIKKIRLKSKLNTQLFVMGKDILLPIILLYLLYQISYFLTYAI